MAIEAYPSQCYTKAKKATYDTNNHCSGKPKGWRR